jgi:hypothetical protein
MRLNTFLSVLFLPTPKTDHRQRKGTHFVLKQKARRDKPRATKRVRLYLNPVQ